MTSETVLLGRGEWILGELVAPALQSAKSYDRVTSFFSLDSFLAVACGIEALWRRGGRMRLIIGIHALTPDLVEAKLDNARWPELVLAELRARLLAQLSTLHDELSRDQLKTLAWMIREGLLVVKVGFPVDDAGKPAKTGIFHPKKYLFTDLDGNRVAAVGSPNETVPGLGGNVEELTVIRSWEAGQSALVDRHFQIFESLWEGGVPGTLVRDVDRSLGDEILARLGVTTPGAGPSPEIAGTLALRVLSRALDSPAFALVSAGRAGFYPHQELAYIEGLSRWPVRVLLADEVGLGKTLEAGAVLSYLLRFGGARRVVILAPRSLMHQWQEELWFRFRIRSWRYESEERTFFDPEGNARSIGLGDSPVGPHAPEIAIVSAQLIRGRGSGAQYFRPGEPRPDILIVDEAHHARIRSQFAGAEYQTRLWKVLDSVAPSVPHLVFLTATPMQLDWTEFHATLRLLGLPSAWQNLDTYEESLGILARGDRAPRLDDVQGALKSMRSSAKDLRISSASLGSGVGGAGLPLLKLDGPISTDEIIAARKHWDLVYPLFVRLHPGHLLTIRRTRSTLTKMGYTFPNRRLEAPPLDIPPEVKSFYLAVQAYLLRSYGAVEKVVLPGSPGGQGFARSTYYQRMASSLQAARLSLERRARHLEVVERVCASGVPAGYPTALGPMDDDEEPDDIISAVLSMRPSERSVPQALAAVERADIATLLKLLEKLPRGPVGTDPKLARMSALLKSRAPGERVLVFSRYTDTISACIQSFREAYAEASIPGFAVYTGDERWADVGTGQQPTSKMGIQEMLDTGLVEVVFCSDAAAEGLNLQAARTVINVDVPWNPSKLEQRIGRVDRLGQTAPEIVVYNLWYPDSVEALMYGRLASRHDLYELAIGEAAEVVASEIQEQVNLLIFGDSSVLSRADALDRLQAVREDLQVRAHQRVWSLDDSRAPLSEKFREDLLSTLAAVFRQLTDAHVSETTGRLQVTLGGGRRFAASSRAGSSDCVTLDHEIVRVALGSTVHPARRGVRPTGAQSAELLTLSCSGSPILFAVKAGPEVCVVPPLNLPSLLRCCALGEPLDIGGMPRLSLTADGLPSTADTFRIVGSMAGWLPDHSGMTCRGISPDVSVPQPPRSAGDRWTLEPLGQVLATVA